jgi:hypothetical protein
MKIKKFNEHNELDPYQEERWDDNELYKPTLKHDHELLTPLFLYMEETMDKIEKNEIYLTEDFPDIYENVFYKVVYGLYGEEGEEFIKKAWKT